MTLIVAIGLVLAGLAIVAVVALMKGAQRRDEAALRLHREQLAEAAERVVSAEAVRRADRAARKVGLSHQLRLRLLANIARPA